MYQRRRILAGLLASFLLLSGCTQGSVSKKEETVTGSAGIKNDLFYVGIYGKNGGINRIQNMNDTNYVNFVIGIDEFIGREEGSKWLGDVDFEYQVGEGDWQTASTTASADTRTIKKRGEDELLVSYEKASANADGIRDFSLSESYRLEGDELIWEVKIKNTGEEDLLFGSIGFPLMFNSPLNGTVTDYYEQTTYVHSCVAYQGSYFYAAPNSGDGPVLVMYPKGDTGIEYQKWNYPDDYGCQTAYPCAGKTAGDNPETSYLDTSMLMLQKGQEITYTFGFAWADSYEQINTVLYEHGKVAVTSVPGMVTSVELPVSVDLYSKEEITEVSASDTEITKVKSENGHNVYQLAFSKLGENRVTIRYGDGKEMALVWFVTEELENLILKNCEFICQNQQQTDPTDACYMAFLPWDLVMENVSGDGLTDEKNCVSETYMPNTWWHTGGDEMGYSSGLYLSEKNVYWPDESQIKQLVDYINIFVYGTMTEQFPDGTYRLHRGAPLGILGTWDGDPRMDEAMRETNEDCWRSYNYPHVINTYYNLYRIQTYYNVQVDGILTADEYLMRAYELARTFFTAWMYPAGGDERGQGGTRYGNMGETMFPVLEETLRAEGHTAEADWLLSQLTEKADYLKTAEYPYTSESAFDTAAYESVYSYAKFSGNEALATEVTRTNIATRGQTPVWYLYGSDLPSQDGGVTLRYMTQIGGWSLLDYTLTYSQNREYDIKLAYGSYLAGWALINSGFYDSNEANLYSSVWYYQGRKGTNMHSVNSWEKAYPLTNGAIGISGESPLGFWAGLKMASTVISEDSVFGLYAYGGTVSKEGTDFHVVPKDGVRKRVHFISLDEVVSFELLQDQFTSLTLSEDRTAFSSEIQNVTKTAHEAQLCVTGMQAGDYTLTVNGEKAGTVTLSAEETELTVKIPAGDGITLSLTK